MIEEKRVGAEPVPHNLSELLTELQRTSLRRIENFGWQIKFIRRPRFQPPVVVVENTTGMNIGILEEDGGVNLRPAISLRD
ncbi:MULTISPECIES: hypothetical protein [unclassified Spongiibacter]|jgi:hypothetical protein|uniref:hypothetical protein n=1 Tax=Spongiibacter TaxID=630749 RepID=UPI000C0B6FC8|nr:MULTISPECIES: hypothetical protein [unclassified Spongiibacter]MAK45242.1 hypothetical protein [Spongiibacter sp.]|tara:strand:+ start:7835 stop:8077 length:243 start_codon:yes stop_codon:yes gene_type:complete